MRVVDNQSGCAQAWILNEGHPGIACITYYILAKPLMQAIPG